MQRILFITLLSTLSYLNIFSQGETKWFDRKWQPTTKEKAAFYRPYPKKEGDYYRVLDYYKNGKLQGSALSMYADKDSFVGTMYGFYINGDTAFTSEYKNGIQNGTYAEFYEQGIKKGIATYTEGVLNGFYAEFFSDGKTRSQGHYNQGILDGNWKVYRYDGKLQQEVNFANGKVTGKYYKRTILRGEELVELEFKGNFLEGEMLDYQINVSTNKTPRVKAKVVNGIEEWKFYTGDTLMLEAFYSNNKRTGEWLVHSPDGKKISATIAYYSDSCGDQEPVDLSKVKNAVFLAERFGGAVNDDMPECATGTFKRFDRNGRLIMEGTFDGNGTNIVTKTEDVPWALRYPKLMEYYTFLSDPDKPSRPDREIHETTLLEDPIIAEAPAPLPPSQEIIYNYVEQPAEFPGGNDALLKYFKANFIYPKQEAPEGYYGTVVMRLVVRSNGVVDSVFIKKGLSRAIDAEAKRVALSFPKFSPARQQGKAVNSYFDVPVYIKVKND